MNGYKYPYIKGGKDMVAATLGACSWIRKDGYFNKAISYYARKYGVDEEQLAANVRARQGAGQKAANKKQTRHYRYFAVEYSMGNEADPYFDEYYARYCVKKGLSVESVQKAIGKNDDWADYRASWHYFGRIEGFDTEEEAKAKIAEWRCDHRSDENASEEQSVEDVRKFFDQLSKSVASRSKDVFGAERVEVQK